MKKYLFPIILSAVVIARCDYVDVPRQAGGGGPIPTSDTIRKILLEDFTGHLCTNCPDAALLLDSIQQAFPHQVIGVAVHIGFFANTCPGSPNCPTGVPAGAFAEDFRSPEENSYDQVFDAISWPLPMGMVNHNGFPLNIPTPKSSWASLVGTILPQPMTAYLKINPSYNASTRQLNLGVNGLMMVDTTGTYALTIYLLEDSLTGWQTDDNLANGLDSEYVFNHVLRACINTPGSILGSTVVTGTIAAGTPFTYTLPAPYYVSTAFNDDHLRIVAYLYKTDDYGVLQAAEAELQ
ncbi:MAG TPA: Omp28-related outer membrane protein [Bacteroidia bacterium]|nr:Omp28-related outer membrane protein [Bacteroidia bacterium]